MVPHSSILAWRIPIDKARWWATVQKWLNTRTCMHAHTHTMTQRTEACLVPTASTCEDPTLTTAWWCQVGHWWPGADWSASRIPSYARFPSGPTGDSAQGITSVLQGTMEHRPGPAFVNKHHRWPTAGRRLIPSGEVLIRARLPWHGHLICLHSLIQQNLGRNCVYEALSQMLKTTRSQCIKRGRDLSQAFIKCSRKLLYMYSC